MAFAIPSLPSIYARIKTSFRAYLPGTDAWIEPNNLSVSGKTFSLGLNEVYQRIGWLYRQLFASTADEFHLEYRHAADLDIIRKPSSAAKSTSAATGVSVAQLVPQAQTVPAGMIFLRDDGVSYISTADATASAGSITFLVQAQSTGAATNCAAGETLTLVQKPSVPNLDDQGIVGTGGILGGFDKEMIELLRARVLFRKKFTPQAGAVADYIRWATEVPGCTRAFASRYSVDCPYVAVFPLFDGTRTNAIPLQSDLDSVTAYIESQRPVGAIHDELPAATQPIDVTIANLSPDTPANRTAIVTSLQACFIDMSQVSTTSEPFTFYAEWIVGAIRQPLPKTAIFTLVGATDTFISFGAMPVLGDIIFQ